MAGVKGMKMTRQLDANSVERIRQRITSSGIAKALIEHINGKKELSATQVSAGLGLLRKVLPDLSATELSGNVTHFGDALARMAKRYEVENAAVLTTETTQPVPSPSEHGHAIH